ncbi:MAG: hypothetical protein K6A30_01890 [Lachnospiraceae bacterium]|nr:hypothetical protein [Lachnospiraceae bacterium]
MKQIMEEYGGILLAALVSVMVLTMNLSVILGPLANTVIYLVSAGN